MKLSKLQKQAAIVRKNDEAKIRLVEGIQYLANNSDFTITNPHPDSVLRTGCRLGSTSPRPQLEVIMDYRMLMGLIEEYSNEYINNLEKWLEL